MSLLIGVIPVSHVVDRRLASPPPGAVSRDITGRTLFTRERPKFWIRAHCGLPTWPMRLCPVAQVAKKEPRWSW
jgi:hypothetical protein